MAKKQEIKPVGNEKPRERVKVGEKDGKAIYKSFYGDTPEEAKRRADAYREFLKKGTDLKGVDMTVRQFLEEWRQRHVINLERKTQEFYTHMIEKIVPVIGGVKCVNLGPLHIETLKERLKAEGVSGTTQNHVFSCLRAAINRGLKWRLWPGDRNPCEFVEAPSRDTEEFRPLTDEELDKLLAAAETDRLGVLYQLVCCTGLREGELLGLKWDDIQWSRGCLYVERSLEGVRGSQPIFGDPKTDKSKRRVPLSAGLLEALARHQRAQKEAMAERASKGRVVQDFGLVFTQRTGGPLEANNFRTHHWYPLLKKAGLPKMRFHGLRHQAATMLLEDPNTSLKDISDLLGHTEIATTIDLYGHGRDHKKQEAVNRLSERLTARRNPQSA